MLEKIRWRRSVVGTIPITGRVTSLKDEARYRLSIRLRIVVVVVFSWFGFFFFHFDFFLRVLKRT